MAALLDYSKLTIAQQDVYNGIVKFGNDRGFSLDQINRVLLLAFAESKFNSNARNSLTIQGAFQYSNDRHGSWVDYCSPKDYSIVGIDIFNTLYGWGYDGHKENGKEVAYVGEFKVGQTDKQIAVAFAEYVVLEKEFLSGSRHSIFKSKYWAAYDAAMADLGNKAPTTQAEQLMLFIEAGHHGPDNISEVVTGWKNKVQPNINRNLLFLRSFKAGSLLNKTDITPEKIANSLISETSTQVADVNGRSPATLQAIQNAMDRKSIISTLQDILSEESGNQIIDVSVTEDRSSLAVTFSNGNQYTINREAPTEYTFQQVTVPSGSTTNLLDPADDPKDPDPDRQGATDRGKINTQLSRSISHDGGFTQIASSVGPAVNENTAASAPADDAPAEFIDAPGSPLQHAFDALGVASKDVHLTPAEADDENETPDSFDIRNNDTAEKIGSYAGTPTGCEMTAGDRKVVMNKISGDDVSVETYAKNDDGEYEILGTSRISDNDGITVRRPFAGFA